ncbi:MAG: excinuclease ABC subunit UvrC [Pseudomonadota bacterium]
MFDAAAYVASLPHLPGVYRMLNSSGEAVYVGKALDLKKRVASYFQNQQALSPRIRLMLAQVANIEITVTRSEAEALLLENNLIKTLAPRYNILFRDDKSYPYLILSGHRYPRLGFHRGATDKRNHYFGPYPNTGAVRDSLHLLQKLFRLRTCEDSVYANRSRPCLLYQIHRCSAPCVGLVDEATYAEDVRNAELFLQGKEGVVLDRLAAAMQQASARQAYEQAAAYRDQIRSLSKIREKQFVSSGKRWDADVVAAVASSGTVCVNLVMIRGGRHLGDKSFFPRNGEGYDAATALEAFLSQHYLQRSVPPLILINQPFDTAVLAQLLEQQSVGKVQIAIPGSGERKVWLAMAEKNAILALQQHQSAVASQLERLAAMQEALDLPDNTRRIECFDVSHTMGEATVASCVVYDQLAMQPGEYRRYNISGIIPGDDYAALRNALQRRYRKIADSDGKLPDLILIDGGKGQLEVASAVMAELGLNEIALLGVAKGEGRKPGLEQLVSPSAQKPLQLPKDHLGLLLIQQIRDEAHRFAIQGHRARRAKSRNASALQDIPGIGAKRRQRLLSRFGGLKEVVAASVDELCQVEGISRALAEKIYQQLH